MVSICCTMKENSKLSPGAKSILSPSCLLTNSVTVRHFGGYVKQNIPKGPRNLNVAFNNVYYAKRSGQRILKGAAHD